MLWVFPFCRRLPYRPMPAPDLSDDERTFLVNLLVEIIERYPFPESQHIQRVRGILAKLRPEPRAESDTEPE
jgi:hypothetical protein